MKYKVGDKVIYNGDSYFKHGEIATVCEVDIEDDSCTYKLSGSGGKWWVHNSNIEPATTEVASLQIDIPTEAMKEFADHCERAAAALERIKAALA